MREGYGDLALRRILPKVKGLGTDTHNVPKKVIISKGSLGRIRADKNA